MASGRILTDLVAMFNTGDFAVNATYTPQVGGATTISVLFIDDLESVDLGLTDYETSAPHLYVRDADVPDIKQDDTFEIDGVKYSVTSKGRSEEGVRVVRLQEVTT